MLSRVVAEEFVRPMASGRTGPSLLVCADANGGHVEVVTKYTSGCDRGEAGLASEVIGACLAADLGLPIMTPYLVELPAEFVSAVPDHRHRQRLEASNNVAFGSKLVTGQFSSWSAGALVSGDFRPIAAAIFAFDGIIQNTDRRDANPNCLVRGGEVRLIDHELAFAHRLILLWRAPWSVGGLQSLETPGAHIFCSQLKGANIDFSHVRSAWGGLSDHRIEAYGEAIPPEWAAAQNDVASALTLIKDARDNIDACISEIRRVLQ